MYDFTLLKSKNLLTYLITWLWGGFCRRGFLWRLVLLILYLTQTLTIITRFNFYTIAHKSISLWLTLWQRIKAVFKCCGFRGVLLGGLVGLIGGCNQVRAFRSGLKGCITYHWILVNMCYIYFLVWQQKGFITLEQGLKDHFAHQPDPSILASWDELFCPCFLGYFFGSDLCIFFQLQKKNKTEFNRKSLFCKKLLFRSNLIYKSDFTTLSISLAVKNQ